MSEKKKQSLFIRIVGPIVIFACLIYTGMGNIGTDFSRELLVQKLEALSQSFARHAHENGKEGKLTYGEITVTGWGFKKHATIKNISLVVSEKGLLDTTKWTLSTATVEVTPDTFVEGQLYFTFPDPINIIENSDQKAVVTFPTPPKYAYFAGKKNKVNQVEHVVSLPASITITPSRSVDDVNVTKSDVLTVTYDANPTLSNIFLLDTKEHKSVVEFKNLKINGEEGARAVATLLSSKFDEKQISDTKLEGHYTLQVTDLLLLIGENEMKPYNITADLSTSSTLSHPRGKEGEPKPAPVATSADIQINQLTLVTSDFDIKVDGKVSEAQDDPLLYGSANLTINNVANFIASELVPQQTRGALAMAIEKIVGTPVDATTSVLIPLNREKNGVFYINNLTFEELAASIFTDLMNAPQDAPGASIDTTPQPSELPETSPADAAGAGAAPYDPVVSAPMETPRQLSPAEKARVPAAGGQ